MAHVLDQWCDYRRYCYNKALELWNATYSEYRMLVSPEILTEFKKPKEERQFTEEQKLFISRYYPTAALIQKKLTASKQSWEKQISSRILQQACADLGKAFKKFAKDKALKVKRGAGHPVFQSKKAKRQGFKLNQGVVLAKEGNHGKLTLPVPAPYKGKWHSIRFSEIPKNAEFGTISFYITTWWFLTSMRHHHTFTSIRVRRQGLTSMSAISMMQRENTIFCTKETMALSILRESMRTSSISSGFWQESWKKMARLPGSVQKAIKKRESSFRSFTSVLTACRMMQCTSTRLTLSENMMQSALEASSELVSQFGCSSSDKGIACGSSRTGNVGIPSAEIAHTVMRKLCSERS